VIDGVGFGLLLRRHEMAGQGVDRRLFPEIQRRYGSAEQFGQFPCEHDSVTGAHPEFVQCGVEIYFVAATADGRHEVFDQPVAEVRLVADVDPHVVTSKRADSSRR
jgi:hypothetical protein